VKALAQTDLSFRASVYRGFGKSSTVRIDSHRTVRVVKVEFALMSKKCREQNKNSEQAHKIGDDLCQ
jgi:hypothetical protein